MIFAIEGLDCSGKTTLWNALRKTPLEATFVPAIPWTKELFKHAVDVQRREAQLWEALHDPAKHYVSDRHFSVSAPVYDRLHGRSSVFENVDWLRRVFVLYVEVPVFALKARFEKRGDEHFEASKYYELKSLYDKEVEYFRHVSLNGCLPEQELVYHALKAINREIEG